MNRITIEDNEKFLRQVSTNIDIKNENYMKYICLLKKYCNSNTVYALAAVQIGIPKRIIYLRNTTQDMTKNTDSKYDEEVILINPIIIERKGLTRFLERCESCLNYVGIVDRPYSVIVKYLDINGIEHIEEFKEFKAIVFSHEFDHLNGILHIDRANEIMQMTWEETRKYRAAHPMEVVSKSCKYVDFVKNKEKYK